MSIEGIIDSITYIKEGTLYGLVNGHRHLVFHDGVKLPESYIGLHVRAYPERDNRERRLHMTYTTDVSYNGFLDEYLVLHTERKPELIPDDS